MARFDGCQDSQARAHERRSFKYAAFGRLVATWAQASQALGAGEAGCGARVCGYILVRTAAPGGQPLQAASADSFYRDTHPAAAGRREP
ncbi:MAG TPA: hypothetical protein VEZ40_15690 [Pyrinomonadaceae bacterium]|nr:hypothetical protein [Pyrinomonadaceae bacterium]